MKPRASRTAVLVASVPEFISRTCSQLGTRAAIVSASFISRGVGAPYDVPSPARGRERRGDRRVGVAEDHRAVALHEVDVAAALDVEHVRALGPGDDVGPPADGLEGADRRVDAAGDDLAASGANSASFDGTPRPVQTTGSQPAAGHALVAERDARQCGHRLGMRPGPRRTSGRGT